MRPGPWMVAAAVAVTCIGCTGARKAQVADGEDRAPPREVHFEPLHVVGDPELESLNDEELFAGGTSAYAANDFKKAARYFGRLADFHPDSRHRRVSLYNAGLAHQRLEEWEQAYQRFGDLSDPERGFGDALDATFRVAETLYHLDRHLEAAAILELVANRGDLSWNKRVEAQVQNGICLLEAGMSQPAESSLRRAVSMYNGLVHKEEVDDYYPSQAQFFLGEIYRLHYESVVLDPEKGTEKLGEDLEHKAQLLLSAQGHYLRAIRMGNGYWATASGARIGGLYENLYDHMVNSPAPAELDAEAAEVYRQELRKKIRILISKAINVYERTLEAAERIGAQNAFVDNTRLSLRKMKDLLLADAQREEEEAMPARPARPVRPAASTDKQSPGSSRRTGEQVPRG
jgi:tetratricopeptide (TPR) repeat protein